MKKLILLVLAAPLLGACGLYNKYERPEVKTDGLVRDAVSDADTLVPTDTASFGNMPWREVFTDPQLQSLIEQGLAKNVDLLNAAQNVKMVEAQLKAAKLAFLPSFTFSPQGAIASWDGNKATKTYSLPVNASWSIDLFGQLLSQKRSAQVAMLATKDYQLVVKTNIISGIANMYYTLLMLDEQVKIVEDMTALSKKTVDDMQVLKDASRGVNETGVLQAKANLLSLQSQAVDLHRQIREVENSLSLLIGQPAQQIARGQLDQQALPENLSTGLPVQMLANRPDVHYAEMSLAGCYYDVQTARSRFYPQLTINATGAFTNNNGGKGGWLLNGAASLVQPIFQRGQIIAGLKVAQAKQEQAYNTWQNAVLQAGSEVSNALVQYNSSKEKAEIEAQRVETLQKNVEANELLLHSKGALSIEVISAQQTLLNARISKVTEEFNKMQAVVSLYQALGGGVN